MEITAEFLESALQSLKREIFSTLHVAMPGILASYDPAARTASVQPALLRRPVSADSRMSSASSNGTTDPISAPLLQDVPVFFCNASADPSAAPAAGDSCLLIFADFCLDGFLGTGQPTLPPSPRSHDLSDAIALVR